jgi:hypothetical protein
MLKIEDPGSSFLLYLGPGPPSLLHLTRANPIQPYVGDTEVQLEGPVVLPVTGFKAGVGLSLCWTSVSLESYIEDKAFSPSYDLAPPPPLPPIYRQKARQVNTVAKFIVPCWGIKPTMA